MPEPLAFLGRMTAQDEREWLGALAAAMPEEAIVLLRDLDPEARAGVEIAIVANPDPAEVASLTGLRWMQSLWAGVERLAAELGPAAPPIVRMTDPEMARVMAESVVAWVHYLQRDMPAYARQQRERVWRPRNYRKPSETRVGLIGLGKLGAAAALRLTDAGFAVSGWARSAKSLPGVASLSGEAGLAELLAQSDIVVCLIPLTKETRGLFHAGRFAAMKPGAAVVNFARGPVVVAEDLIEALDAGRLSHAVLDVFDAEPLPEASPFWRHPDVTVLPHISAPTDPQTASALVAQNIRSFRRTGLLPETVDVERGY